MSADTDDTAFLESIIFFLQEYSDPTRYAGFDEERFRRAAPTLHAAWVGYKLAQDTLHRLTRDHKANDLY